MHIPLIAKFAPMLIPYLSPDRRPPGASSVASTSQTIFEPMHAFAHSSHPTRPRVLIHNMPSSESFTAASIDFGTLSAEEQEEHLLDHPRPDLASEPLSIRTTTRTIRRPRIRPPTISSWALSAQRDRSPEIYSQRHGNGSMAWSAPRYDDHEGWDDVEVRAPDITDRQTLIAMAKMASNAYTTPDVDGEWWPLGGWNQTIPFGWEKDADGLRGHVVSPRSTAVCFADNQLAIADSL